MKAHELLAPEGAWTQGAAARDAEGAAIPPEDPFAVSFCLLGAVRRCYSNSEPAVSLIRRTLNACKVRARIGNWNDNPKRTQAEVVALLKELDI